MKAILMLLCSLLLGISSGAAKYNPDVQRLYDTRERRTEITLPQVDGYNCYKADLHVHTIFSDGDVTPEERVCEAWTDGLDILAITDHIETRRHERTMLRFLKNYSPDGRGFEPVNTRCSRGVPADERGIIADLNLPCELAASTAQLYPDIFVIKGAEISREPVKIGHYCALFTKDNNAIYDRDDLQTLRNARAQGALITHNHPGWNRTSVDITEFEKRAYAEGLIDGIEVVNGRSFYPKIVRRAIERGFYMVSATDIHKTTSMFHAMGCFRNMTFIFASERSEAGIREALNAHRTLCYCNGYVIGAEALLTKFFKASVKVEKVNTDAKGRTLITLANNSSLEYRILYDNEPHTIPAHGKMWLRVTETNPKFEVANMIHVDNQHPVVEYNIAK